MIKTITYQYKDGTKLSSPWNEKDEGPWPFAENCTDITFTLDADNPLQELIKHMKDDN